MSTKSLAQECSWRLSLNSGKLETAWILDREYINTLWHNHTMEYYLTIKRNGLLKHRTTRMNLKNTLSEILR